MRLLALPLLAALSAGPNAAPATSTLSLAIDNEISRLDRAMAISHPDPRRLEQALITFHHALLAREPDANQVVMSLSSAEQAQLTTLGFRVAPATDWRQRRRNQLQQLSERHATPRQAKAETDHIEGFSCYPTVEATFDQASALTAQFPQLASWLDIGDSWQKTAALGGHDLRVLKLTNKAIVGDKPKLFVHSAMHAREYTTAALNLDFAHTLLNGYQTEADIRWILDHHEIHLLLQMNPDGRKMAEQGLFWRKNTNQDYCGVDSPQRGADLNRNFSHGWGAQAEGSSGEACASTYRGPVPASEPETRAVEAYIRQLFADRRGSDPNDPAPADTQGLHIDLHSFSELILWPWGDTEQPAPNGAALATLGRKLAYFNGYTPMQSVGLYPTNGTSDGVSYGELGVPAIAFELGTTFFQPCEDYQATIKPDNLEALLYAAKVVRAPYLLPAGPDVTDVTLNGLSRVTVPRGVELELQLNADDNRYQHSRGQEPSQTVSQVAYYLDIPPWQANASAVALEAADGSFDSARESVDTLLDTSPLSEGEHLLYVRAQDSLGQWGPPSAVLLTIGDNPPPEARFSASCEPTGCRFDASASSDSDGDIAHYHWDLGNGEVASGAILNYQYATAGNYQITLTITDALGARQQLSRTLAVVAPAANQLPSASFTAECTELSCRFDAAASSDPDGELTQYAWQFGDGQAVTLSGTTAEHSYTKGGEYRVSLTVSDNRQGQQTAEQVLTVTAPLPPEIGSEPGNSGGGAPGGLLLLVGSGWLWRRLCASRH